MLDVLSIESRMTLILGAQLIVLGMVGQGLKPLEASAESTWLAAPRHKRKRACEIWFLGYGVFWILAFAVIVSTGIYEKFTAWTYLIVCFGLALPLYLQPFVIPSLTCDDNCVWYRRYSLKANLWLLIFGFTGNYWYTHYFYTVLNASYTMPSFRLNGVPLAMWFATHFYFCFYHTISNAIIRKVLTSFQPTFTRIIFLVLAIASLSYATAFAETLTISAFPYWHFQDRHAAYVLGSAFYALYFIVSFPLFFILDELPANITDNLMTSETHSLLRTCIDALAASMAVLYLLDFTRISIVHTDLYIQAQPSLFVHTSLGINHQGEYIST